MKVNIYEAKNTLSELVKRAEQGEEIILSRHGRPVVKRVKLPPKTRELGLSRGQIKVRW
jgi:antitoxin (DNA-binding transcriptional repressor) of toxin-antitoxin stability system